MFTTFLIQLLRTYLLLTLLLLSVADADVAKPGCNDSCGGVMIPYPFGIGDNCSVDDNWFLIDCKLPSPDASMPKPFLSAFNNIEVVDLQWRPWDSSTPTVRVRIPPLNACNVDLNSLDLRGSPYDFSGGYNVLVMEGCPGSAVLVNQSKDILGGCATACESSNSSIPRTKNSTANRCYGVQCCQTYVDTYYPLQFYQIEFNGRQSQNCLVATLLEVGYTDQFAGNLSNPDPLISTFPVALGWSFVNRSQHMSPYATCVGVNGDYCGCKDGYYGNPYISNGCQVAQECKNCRGDCYGNWDMKGRLIYPNYQPTCIKKPILTVAAIVGFSVSLGIVVLVIVLYGLYRFIKRKRELRRRAKFFKRNGGLLLQQQLSSNKGFVERTRIFSETELDKATDHFNANRILGQGGQGTVYKGMLSDGRIVAVKKSKLLDESQLEQFINEVVILSQVNHRNAVKLLGCCLETEVPLLVYEFVPNGTLFQHIHDPDEDFAISWEMCLKIAADSAAAVAYLHSSSSIPIYHRDIKSSNILLDEKHRAKVSDFGSSKTIAIDQTHMTTLVQGTLGYLDPEYFQSYKFTEKSDVYSFGVVLLELITRKKPIYMDSSIMEQKNLVMEFLFVVENSRLSEILDPEIMREAEEDELMSVVELARRCTCGSGKLRPTMKEVAMTLEMIMKSPAQVSRWYQEQEALPIEDAGFGEYDIADISDAEFISSTLPAGAASPPCTDAHPLFPLNHRQKDRP